MRTFMLVYGRVNIIAGICMFVVRDKIIQRLKTIYSRADFYRIKYSPHFLIICGIILIILSFSSGK